MDESKSTSTRELPTSVLLLVFLLFAYSITWFVVSSAFHTGTIAALTIADKGYEKLYQSITEKVPKELLNMPQSSTVSEKLSEGKLVIGLFTLALYALAVLYALAGIGIYKLKKWSAILTCILALAIIAIAFMNMPAGIPCIAFNILLVILAIVSWKHLK